MMNDLAPERRKQADRRKAVDEKIDKYFFFFAGAMFGSLIVIMAEAI